MRARPQRNLCMGQSNRKSSMGMNHTNNQSFDIFQKSINKTKSQYYYTMNNNKINHSLGGLINGQNHHHSNHYNSINNNFSSINNSLSEQQSSPTTKYYTSQLNINTIYKDAQKGHHHQFEHTKLMNNKKPIQFTFNNNNKTKLINNQQHQQQLLILNPPTPLNMSNKLNSTIIDIKQLLSKNTNPHNNQQINLYKIKQLKKTFLRNNQKRRNLKEYFNKYVNKSTGKVDNVGFKRLIKQYGYDINDTQIMLVFKLNDIHNSHSNNTNGNNSNSGSNNKSEIDLGEFIDLMTKQNIYFNTLKPSQQSTNPTNNNNTSINNNFKQTNQQSNKQQLSRYKFSPAQFEIFRNKYSKLKQALKIYKDQPITKDIFQKVMKKLDITNLVIKQSQRSTIFDQFANNNQLNVQRLLGQIATQQNQRVSNQQQMKLTNHDQFQLNIQANQQYKFQKYNQNDPLLQLLYPKNLKTSSFVDYQKTVKQAKDICQCLQKIKKTNNKDVIKQILQNDKKLPKDLLYKRVQKVLQSQGYNFNTNEYKSFISYIDFDSSNNVSKQKLQNFIFKQDQPRRVNRLDRRVRNQDKSQKLLSNNHLIEQKNPQDQFVDKMRAKSSVNWNTMKKTFIKDSNIPQFNVPTKFSAWPQRLYQTDLSLIQPKSTYGMGINEQSRFRKEQKHSFAQQDRLKRLLNYESKVKKVAEWQQSNSKKIQQISRVEEKKQQSKLYNMRLLKQQYEDRCHSRSFVQ